MSIYVNVCQCMSTYVNICQYMSMYVNICQYMSIYVNICQCVPNIHWGTPFSDKPILYMYILYDIVQIDSFYIMTTPYLCTSSQVNVISQL